MLYIFRLKFVYILFENDLFNYNKIYNIIYK